MMDGLKPYPEYKDSGLPWLGPIPAHWEVKRGKNLFRCVDVRSQTGNEELLTVSAEHGVIPRKSANVTMFKAESYVGHKLCWPGDLVINSLWAWARGLGVSRFHGIVSSAYGVYRLRENLDADPWFFHALVRSNPFHWELQVRSKGIWTSRLQLTDESFLGAPFPIPPPSEQRAIAHFLDHTNRLIRRYIRAQRRLIELLEEQKQALIQRAVTRGLNPDVPLKDSGVEWLGEIPAHWGVRKLKYCAGFNPSKSESHSLLEQNKPVVFLPMEKVSEDGLVDCTEKHPVKELWNGYTYFRRHDVVIAKITPCFENGKGAYLGMLETEVGFGTTEFIVLRANDLIEPQFLYQITVTPAFRTRGAEAMTGAAGQQRVPLDFVRNFEVPLPPLDEQKEILEFVHLKTTGLKAAISSTQRQIDLVREYRTRLIADVVTGKLDVRGVHLPDEIETAGFDRNPPEPEEVYDD